MTNFKPGDRVRILIDQYPTNAPKGALGTVQRITEENGDFQALNVDVDTSYVPGFGWFFTNGQLEYADHRTDWTALTDQADEFVAALALAGNYVLASFIRDLKDALIEETYR